MTAMMIVMIVMMMLVLLLVTWCPAMVMVTTSPPPPTAISRLSRLRPEEKSSRVASSRPRGSRVRNLIMNNVMIMMASYNLIMMAGYNFIMAGYNVTDWL